MGQITVGQYLVKRLEEAGVKHVFGVPGDYVLRFFDCLEASNIKVIGTCNELDAGYATDAYARINGIGCACVTYGVGGFSLFNAAVGAFAERVPMIIISGAPRSLEHDHRHLLHHTIGDMDLQRDIYSKITIATATLLNPAEAPRQIDETIAACLREKRPVYIEIPADIVNTACAEPKPLKFEASIESKKAVLDEALDEAVAMLKSAAHPVILAGVEAHRFGLRKELEDLIDHTGYAFATTILGKAVIPEKHPQFLGPYCGAIMRETARLAVEGADVLLSLGNLMTDIDLGAGTARLDVSKAIIANSDKVRIKHHKYDHVNLKDFILGLRSRLPKAKADLARIDHPSARLKEKFTVEPERKISLDRFYDRVNRFLKKDHIVVSDTGDCLFCTAAMYLPEGIEYIGQAFYLSIGYAVPGTLGVGLAAPLRRPILFVGDGAFQMTAQEVSTMIRAGLKPVIFLLNNDGYTIERMIYDGPYNDIQMWKYHMLPQVFGGGWGCEVKTEGELEEALERADKESTQLAFIEVRLDKLDYSEALKKMGKELRK